MTDGPYAEARELVGGFFIIEAADKDEAVRVASLYPSATLGESVGWGIEVHPIGFLSMHTHSSGRTLRHMAQHHKSCFVLIGLWDAVTRYSPLLPRHLL
ncbi:MAG: YciI family protein [Polaromonas sp.]|uniref:YciI family protein n=1 Tax=Polaromonas sp. TaxID=1869339 RepID=UPI00248A65F5|nr:YciI family protein [Polaromonas sp.]MDI1238060.1 YciI family protein [Polaromonas sp.]MDI1338792.1 YciI family protein [Polaromonas sp.]